jgi:hypothetical protein
LHSQTGTAAELGVADGSGGVAGLTLGGGWTDDIRFSLQACGLDEVALWNAPLTDVEIAAARAGSMPGMTDEWSTVVIGAGGSTNPFAVQSGLVPDGYVLASDGAGGTTYIRSGGTFYHNGA